MESQLQCPVCTLFLHAGMDLQSHLETHPKDQVIKALVNITMTKQSNDPNTASNNNVHSRYAPIAENVFTQEMSQYLPEPIPRRPQQVLFGYTCSTRQSTTTQKFITNALPASHIVSTIPSQTSFTNQQNRKFPPPPYGSIVSKKTIEQPVQTLSSTSSYKLQARQVDMNSQRSGALYLPVQNLVNEVQTVRTENDDEYANETDQNIEFIEHEHCDEEYLDHDVETTNPMDQDECSAYEDMDPLQDNRIIRPNSVIYVKDDEPIDVKHDAQNQKKFTEGLRVLSDVKLPATVDILNNLDCKFGESFQLDDVLRTRPETDCAPIEVYESADEDNDLPVAGGCGNEFAKPSLNKTMKCEIDVAKTIKTELEGEKQQQYQNKEEVSVL